MIARGSGPDMLQGADTMATQNPPPAAAPARLKHPGFLVFLLGGIVGGGLNVGVSCAARFWLGKDPLLSIFLGTLANEAFHYLYYSVVFVNQEVRWRMGAPWLFLMYLAMAG